MGTRIWIDVANSPHATLFAPVVEEFRGRGHRLTITAWDRAQTEQLARSFWPQVRVVGAGSDRSIAGKGMRIYRRARALAREMRSERPDVALGHNSYSQLVAARALRIPAITMMDYEHQPANHLAFRLARRVVVPEVFPGGVARKQGASGKILRYPGYKEEITLAGFHPDPSFRASIGVGEDEVMVACRPPPDGALYHRHPNALFDAAVRLAVARRAVVVLSPRDGGQAARFGSFPGVRVLNRAIPGDNFVFHADAVIGAGGTMTREAAILGTPAYSLFNGRPSAVDSALIRSGSLTRIATFPDLREIALEKRTDRRRNLPDRHALERIVRLIEEAASALCSP